MFSPVGPRADSVQAAVREGGPAIPPPGHLPFASGARRPRVPASRAGRVPKGVRRGQWPGRAERGEEAAEARGPGCPRKTFTERIEAVPSGCPLRLPGDTPFREDRRGRPGRAQAPVRVARRRREQETGPSTLAHIPQV